MRSLLTFCPILAPGMLSLETKRILRAARLLSYRESFVARSPPPAIGAATSAGCALAATASGVGGAPCTPGYTLPPPLSRPAAAAYQRPRLNVQAGLPAGVRTCAGRSQRRAPAPRERERRRAADSCESAVEEGPGAHLGIRAGGPGPARLGLALGEPLARRLGLRCGAGA